MQKIQACLQLAMHPQTPDHEALAALRAAKRLGWGGEDPKPLRGSQKQEFTGIRLPLLEAFVNALFVMAHNRSLEMAHFSMNSTSEFVSGPYVINITLVGRADHLRSFDTSIQRFIAELNDR